MSLKDDLSKEFDRRKKKKTLKEEVAAEKRRRQLASIPDDLLNRCAGLTEEEFNKLGHPPVVSNGSDGWLCNCPEGDLIYYQFGGADCRRCGGYSY